MKRILLCFMFLFFLISCASKPKLYPNTHLKNVGKDQSQADIKVCMSEADEYLEGEEGKRILKDAGRGAGFGAIVGGAFGLFTGNVGEGAVRGAAVGGVGSGAASAVSPNQLKRAYVNRCLGEKGYEVIGWN